MGLNIQATGTLAEIRQACEIQTVIERLQFRQSLILDGLFANQDLNELSDHDLHTALVVVPNGFWKNVLQSIVKRRRTNGI
jgi:hypothetical protein